MGKSSPAETSDDPFVGEPEMDAVSLEKHGRAQCTLDETARYFGLTTAQLESRLAASALASAYARGRAQGIVALREAQFKLAATSVPMATLLGKIYLDQSERESDGQPPFDRAAAAERIRAKILSVAAAAATMGDGEPPASAG